MELTLTSTLALFVLIALSTAIFFIAKHFKLPYTVLLVGVGLLLVPIVNLPYLRNVFGFIGDMVLTPELLFYIFLPILIFESAFNMNIRKMVDNAWAISSLAIVSVLVSTFLIALLMYYVLPLIGVPIPFIVALLFGALISSTDPVAVLSLFKEVGVPPRLTMIFEGECLLNDGTAMALFFVVLAVALGDFNGAETVAKGVVDFTVMIFSGVLIGLVMAALFSRALRFTRSNEFVTVTLLIISAHLVFILTELINSLGYFHVSSIIATAVAALFLGNYSRNVLEPKVDEYLGKLIEHMAFVANSLVFLMAGLLFANSGVDISTLWLPILITVLVVALSRIVSVYCVTVPLNYSGLENRIPSSWQKLLAWGSLRGSLSIIIVLLIPENFKPDGWNYTHSPRDFLLALTIGCILATLFIKAPMIAPLMRRYNINPYDPLKAAYESDMSIYYLQTSRSRLQAYRDKGFYTEEHYQKILARVEEKLQIAEKQRLALLAEQGETAFVQSLHLAMVRVEMTTLKRLYLNYEINEKNYRKLHGKLCLQQEKIEYAQHNKINPDEYMDRKDVFDRMVSALQSLFTKKLTTQQYLEERLQYYRAQMIMARKAVLVMERIQTAYNEPVYMQAMYEKVTALYEGYRQQSQNKLEALVAQYEEQLSGYRMALAERAMAASGEHALAFLHDVGLMNEMLEHDIHKKLDAQIL